MVNGTLPQLFPRIGHHSNNKEVREGMEVDMGNSNRVKDRGISECIWLKTSNMFNSDVVVVNSQWATEVNSLNHISFSNSQVGLERLVQVELDVSVCLFPLDLKRATSVAVRSFGIYS